MKKQTVFNAIVILLFAMILYSCKPNDPATPQPKKVKYEITGNFSGQFIIVYNDNSSGNTVLNNVSLPWSKELTYPSSVVAVGIGAQASVVGVAGQTATMKIIVNGAVAKSSNATAGSLGEMVLPALAHGF